MLTTVQMYTITCDACGITSGHDAPYSCWDDPQYSEHEALESGWIKGDTPDTHYCPKCHTYDDNDNLIIANQSITNHQ